MNKCCPHAHQHNCSDPTFKLSNILSALETVPDRRWEELGGGVFKSLASYVMKLEETIIITPSVWRHS